MCTVCRTVPAGLCPSSGSVSTCGSCHTSALSPLSHYNDLADRQYLYGRAMLMTSVNDTLFNTRHIKQSIQQLRLVARLLCTHGVAQSEPHKLSADHSSVTTSARHDVSSSRCSTSAAAAAAAAPPQLALTLSTPPDERCSAVLSLCFCGCSPCALLLRIDCGCVSTAAALSVWRHEWCSRRCSSSICCACVVRRSARSPCARRTLRCQLFRGARWRWPLSHGSQRGGGARCRCRCAGEAHRCGYGCCCCCVCAAGRCCHWPLRQDALQ